MRRISGTSSLALYFVLAYAFTWAYWVPQALTARGLLGVAVPDSLAILAGYGPALAALVVTALVSGRTGLRELARRLVLWRVGWLWWAVVLLLPAAMALAALGLHLLTGGDTPSAGRPPALLTSAPGTPLWQQLALLALIFVVGFDGLGEEVGWRGFALPRLLRRSSALLASLVLGVLWWLWHLPFALTPGTAMSTLPFYAYLPGILAQAVLFTWIFNHTRGSVLVAILFHAASNTTANALPVLTPSVQDVGVWGVLVPWGVALAVIAYGGPRHLSRRRPTVPADIPA